MSDFICPVCRERLWRDGSSMRCPGGHSYDISRRGYVNLLMSQVSSKKRHGDDSEMVSARTDFLSLGHYDALRDKVTEIVSHEISARGGGMSAGRRRFPAVAHGCGFGRIRPTTRRTSR